MPTKVALLVISVLLGAGVAALGLYFGTDLFQRDPLAGMEAEPITEPKAPEAAVARIEEVAWLATEAEAASTNASDAEPPSGKLAGTGVAARPVQLAPDTADAVAAAAPFETDADETEVSAPEAPPLAPPRGVKRWKPSYIPVADPKMPEVDTAAASTAEAAAAERAGARQPISLRQPLRLVDIAAAGVVNDTRMSAVESVAPIAWKTSLPLLAHARDPQAENAAAASALEPAEPLNSAAATPPMLRDRMMLADARRAVHAGGAKAAELAPRAFVEWKTSPALAAKLPMAKAGDDLLAAPVEQPEVAPEAATIAIETIDFQDPDRITIAGLTQPDALVRVHLNGEPLEAIHSDSLGIWRVNGRRELGGGRHLVRAEVFDSESVRQASAEMRFERVQIVMGEPPPLAEAAREAPPAEESDLAETRTVGPTAVHIERGDNLWHIARAIYGDGHLYTEIYEVNRNQIRNPDLIYPGQVFTIPILENAE